MVTPSDRKKIEQHGSGTAICFECPVLVVLVVILWLVKNITRGSVFLMGSISLLRFFFLGQVFR